MKKLSDNWFVEGCIDFEHKQYVLLAYLEEVKKQYSEIKLYPALSDLIAHYRNLQSYKQSKTSLEEQFPQTASAIDWSTLSIVYEKLIQEDLTLQEIDTIVEYGLSMVPPYVHEGKELYETIDEKLCINPIGILPLYKQEGYLLLRTLLSKAVQVYQYKVVFFEQNEEKYNGIHVAPVAEFEYSLTCTYENIKIDLIHSRKELPNPATYVVESELQLPVEETLLPITKRKLLKLISSEA